MKLTPVEFIEAIKNDKNVAELNLVENPKSIEQLKEVSKQNHNRRGTFNHLVRYYGHTEQSAQEYLNTDYSDGYTICKKCGSFYQLGKGFTKHISNGCVHCESNEKHPKNYNNGDKRLGFAPRWMCCMFDDGLHYCADKLEIEKYKNEVQGL
jgi:hypothetical protein